jgi:hypothetical protein
MNIAETLSGIRTILVAKNFEQAVRAWAARDARRPGVDPAHMQRAADEAIAMYREGLKYMAAPDYKTHDGTPKEIVARADSVTGFLYARESAGIKNPIVFSAAKLARHGKDWDVGLLVLPGKSLRGKALVNGGADKFQQEVEVHGDVPIKAAGYLTSGDLQRYRRGLHGLRVVKRKG